MSNYQQRHAGGLNKYQWRWIIVGGLVAVWGAFTLVLVMAGQS
jgi:hypothetical protein